MCGLVAVFSGQPIASQAITSALQQMFRRGPDGEGIWEGERVALGHRRLAIIDLDERAAQPMSSQDERYVIVFNGEIYNYRTLKVELEKKGAIFSTNSDTEVLLVMYQEYGAEMLPRLEGMFAFVIWDKLKQVGIAARDAYGIKPLYFGTFPGGIIFASQVKAILASNMVSPETDMGAQEQFWMLGSVPEPLTWFKNIHSLEAGQIAHISKNFELTLETWVDIGKYWRNSDRIIKPSPPEHTQAEVKGFLKESVRRHLVSDVPVGLFLSGGIDSGALAGLMADELGADKVTGITICFDEFKGDIADEVPVAREIAQYYGIKHHIRRVTKAEFLGDLPAILQAMDQPSIDGVNTWYACKAASEIGLKVVLSGVGGDELLLGYTSFKSLPKLVKRYRNVLRLPFTFPIAKYIASLLASRLNNTRWIFAPDWLKSIAGAWWLRRSFASPLDLPTLIKGKHYSQKVAMRDFDPNVQVYQMTRGLPRSPELALAQIESMCYLRNQLLRDADWASMSHSVELRTPLVDEKLLRSIAPLMHELKHFSGKSLLANAPNKPLPESIASRPKTGFGIPIARWLQQEGCKGSSNHDRWSWARKVVNSYGI